MDELVEDWGYTAHIARKGVDQSKRKRIPRYCKTMGCGKDPLLDEPVQDLFPVNYYVKHA